MTEHDKKSIRCDGLGNSEYRKLNFDLSISFRNETLKITHQKWCLKYDAPCMESTCKHENKFELNEN